VGEIAFALACPALVPSQILLFFLFVLCLNFTICI
jgi:hypothetical protein